MRYTASALFMGCPCGFISSRLGLFALIGSEQEGHDLSSRAVVIRAERSRGSPFGDVLLHRPKHRIGVVGVRLHIGKGVHRARR